MGAAEYLLLLVLVPQAGLSTTSTRHNSNTTQFMIKVHVKVFLFGFCVRCNYNHIIYSRSRDVTSASQL